MSDSEPTGENEPDGKGAVTRGQATIEAEQDPLPDGFDKEQAADTVDRLLGISQVDMPDDVKALLWTHTLRRLGVLTGPEYELRKKRLLARDIPAEKPSTTPVAGGGGGGPATTPKTGAAPTGSPEASEQ